MINNLVEKINFNVIYNKSNQENNNNLLVSC
jgi:hypothetical protein